MKSEAVRIAQEETSREVIKAITHPVVLFIGGVYAINWMADRPGGMGQAQGFVLDGILAAVCLGSALAPAFPGMLAAGGPVATEALKALAPALGTMALVK